MKRLPSFRVVSSGETYEDPVFLVDLDDDIEAPSVTNGAEQVVERIIDDYGPHRRIFYRDSMGHWDELAHDGRRFTGFKAGTDGFTPPAARHP
jgi:hypothetical protein